MSIRDTAPDRGEVDPSPLPRPAEPERVGAGDPPPMVRPREGAEAPATLVATVASPDVDRASVERGAVAPADPVPVELDPEPWVLADHTTLAAGEAATQLVAAATVVAPQAIAETPAAAEPEVVVPDPPPMRRPTAAAGEPAPAPSRSGRRSAAVSRPTGDVRRVRRVLRHVDIWSLFRFATLLYLCSLVVFMTAAVGLWLLASGAGAIPSIENFITQLFALKRFQFKAFQLFLGTLGVGVIGVFVATLMTMVTGVLYNLISDVVGGIEVTVLEEPQTEVGDS